MTFLARGDVALSVTITSCTTLLAPIVTPFLIYLFANQWISINPTAMFWSICQIVLLPIIAGVVVKSLLKDKVKAATTVLPLVSAVAIVLIPRQTRDDGPAGLRRRGAAQFTGSCLRVPARETLSPRLGKVQVPFD